MPTQNLVRSVTVAAVVHFAYNILAMQALFWRLENNNKDQMVSRHAGLMAEQQVVYIKMSLLNAHWLSHT